MFLRIDIIWKLAKHELDIYPPICGFLSTHYEYMYSYVRYIYLIFRYRSIIPNSNILDMSSAIGAISAAKSSMWDLIHRCCYVI